MQVWLLGLFLLLHPNHETVGCDALLWYGTTGPVSESTSPVLLGLAEVYRERGNIEMPVVVCESSAGLTEGSVPMASAQVHTDADGVTRGYVHIPTMLLAQFNALAVEGLMGHEVAHLVLPRSVDCKLLLLRLDVDKITNEDMVACQTPADAKAAEWAGTLSVHHFLTAVRDTLAPYEEVEKLRDDHYTRMKLRIEALKGE